MGKKALMPNLVQKRFIAAAKLDWKDYLVLKETAEELHLVRKGDGRTRVIKKNR